MTFRIIPRTAVYGDGVTESLLILPDIPANAGCVGCYASVGEHSEASLTFYHTHTRAPDENALRLAQWYLKNKCEPDDKAVIRRRMRWRFA